MDDERKVGTDFEMTPPELVRFEASFSSSEQTSPMNELPSSSSLVRRVQQANEDLLRESVALKRQSLALTASEQSFLDHLLEHGTVTDLAAVDANLSDTSLFFAAQKAAAVATATTTTAHGEPTSNTTEGEYDKASQPKSLPMGSTKRQEYLESRRSCCQANQKLMQAAQAVIAAQRIGKSTRIAHIDDDSDTVTEDEEERTYVQRVEFNEIVVDETVQPKKRSNTLVSNQSSYRSLLSVPESLLSISEDEYEKDACAKKEEEEDVSTHLSLQEEKKSDDEVDDKSEDGTPKNMAESMCFPNNNSTTCLSPGWTRRNSTASAASRQQLRSELIKTASVCMYHGEGFEVGNADSFEMYKNVTEHYDPWMFETTDEEGHKRLDVHILGTSRDDMAATPHVLSPILMHSLQPYLPHAHRGASFWLKYSLVRDGASLISFLHHVRASQHTILAFETVDGEVFGFFGTQPWKVQPSYFGTGESFVWKMKHSRILENGEQYHNGTLLEQAQREAEIEVYPSANPVDNQFYQLCEHERVAIGGGVTKDPRSFGNGDSFVTYQPEEMGFALVFDDASMMYGSSYACMTFESPPLSKHHVDGSRMEFVNVEVWALTPCLTVDEAHLMENRQLFLKRNATI
ncbi:TLD domain containing protein [Nitzschia inconspicua]|uniref:Oxidation resistance protein 1 n=1 Tax=Nitzschia inconspicua TaxID=303405 RepID=A0A9K3KRU6_9STRA|nr:TLD domain containing protein [Nitzschia inconspicua]